MSLVHFEGFCLVRSGPLRLIIRLVRGGGGRGGGAFEKGWVVARGRRYKLINSSYIVVHTWKKRKQKMKNCTKMTTKLCMLLIFLQAVGVGEEIGRELEKPVDRRLMLPFKGTHNPLDFGTTSK